MQFGETIWSKITIAIFIMVLSCGAITVGILLGLKPYILLDSKN
jgi:hypothetical protein